MTEKKKRSTPRLIKLLILLVMAAVIIYAGIVGYVCIREGSVQTDVPDADNYDAIIVLGAQVKRDGTPNVQLGWRLDAAYDASDRAALAKTYVDYYRSRVRYLMENTKSLTSIPVLYQKINDHFPVFGQATDALHFRTVYDSLMTVYPESKYVKALGQEATSRMNVLELNAKISQAQSLLEEGYKKLVSFECKNRGYEWFGADPGHEALTAYGLTKWHLPYYSPADKSNPEAGLVKHNKFGSNLLRHLVFGLEFVPKDNMWIGLGYNYKTRTDMATYKRSLLSGFSIGAGLKVKAFGFNLAFAQPHSGATTFMFNLTTSIGELMH